MLTSGIYTREQYMDESSHVHRHMYTQHNFRKVLCACYFCVVVNGMPIRNDWSRERPSLACCSGFSPLCWEDLGRIMALQVLCFDPGQASKNTAITDSLQPSKSCPQTGFFYLQKVPHPLKHTRVQNQAVGGISE